MTSTAARGGRSGDWIYKLGKKKQEQENESKNEAVKKYFKDIEIFEREFEDLDSSLSAEKEAALRSLLEDGSKDPDKLARDIAKLWGIDENS